VAAAEISGSIRVSSYRSPLYLPQYVAAAEGYFRANRLDVTFVPAFGEWQGIIAAVTEGRADVLVGNVWFALKTAASADPLVAFASCSQQSRYVVLRRHGTDRPFKWSDLEGATVVFPSDVGTPWVAFREVLRLAGVSLERVNVLLGFSPSDALAEFHLGVGDFTVSAVERVDPAVLERVASFADVLGPVPWAVYCAPRSMVEKRRPLLTAYSRAIGDADRWIADHSAAEIVSRVATYLPDSGTGALESCIERYKELDLWPRDPSLHPEEFARWQDALVRWGLLRQSLPLDEFLADALAT
jgi:NitT/TauT family transport system substrate-binding protein